MFIEARLYNLTQPELEMGEALLWAGQPNPKRFALRPVSILVFVCGVAWTASIASFIHGWYDVPQRDFSGPHGLWRMHGIAASLFFVPFVLIGLGMMLSPVWHYIAAVRTVYAITPKRVFVMTGFRSRKVQSYTAREIGFIERTEHADGTGDLTFARKPTKDSEGDPTVEEIQLVGIPEVRSVESLLRETFDDSWEGRA